LVERAAGRGVTHLALTDHDTLDGFAEAQATAEEVGIRLIAGIELSCQWKSNTIHIVGLDFDPFDEKLLQRIATQNTNRWQRAREIATKLEKIASANLLDMAVEFAGGTVPGRPHFAQALIKAGVVTDHGEAFKKYLGTGKKGDVKAFWPELADIPAWIKEAGGVAVLAHPRKYRMSATKLREMIDDFQAAGGQAMEVAVSGQSSGDTGFLAEMARRKGLLASVGSDFHGPGAPWCELGTAPALPAGLSPVWQAFQS